jgi:hypothetical protein
MSSLRKLPPTPVKSNTSTTDTKQSPGAPETTDLPTIVVKRDSGLPQSIPRLALDKNPTTGESNIELDMRAAVETTSPSNRTQSQTSHQDAPPEPKLVSGTSDFEIEDSAPKVSPSNSEDSLTKRFANGPGRERPRLVKRDKRLSILEPTRPQRPPPPTPFESFLSELTKDLSDSPPQTTTQSTEQANKAVDLSQTLSSPRKSLGAQSRPHLLRAKTNSRPATTEQTDLSPTKIMSSSAATLEVISEIGIATADRNSTEVGLSEKKEEN